MIPYEFQRFVVIYEEQNLSKAADRLDTEQSLMSKSLSKLELQLGQKLFIRSNRGLKPTDFGKKFYLQIQFQMKSWEKFRRSSHVSSETLTGLLKLGGHKSIFSQYVKVLASLHEKFPDLQMEYVFDRSPETLRKVLNHEIDVGLVVNPQAFNDLIIKPLKQESVHLFSSKREPANKIVYNPELMTSYQLIKKVQNTHCVPVRDYDYAALLAKSLNSLALLPDSIAQAHGLKYKFGKALLVAKICIVYRLEYKEEKRILELLKVFRFKTSLYANENHY